LPTITVWTTTVSTTAWAKLSLWGRLRSLNSESVIVHTLFPTSVYRIELVLEVFPVWDRLLFAIDQFESGQSALEFVAGVASANDASVRVLHIREVPRMARVLPLETPGEAKDLVRQTVSSLQLFGVPSEGRSCSVLQERVARRMVEEAMLWECQGIVLGSRRLHGISRLSGRGVKERILRLSSLPVLVAPAAESNGVFWPPRFGPNREHPEAVTGRRVRGVGDRGFPQGLQA
jgi:nucleotide-binding universal stress UspA family protein